MDVSIGVVLSDLRKDANPGVKARDVTGIRLVRMGREECGGIAEEGVSDRQFGPAGDTPVNT